MRSHRTAASRGSMRERRRPEREPGARYRPPAALGQHSASPAAYLLLLPLFAIKSVAA